MMFRKQFDEIGSRILLPDGKSNYLDPVEGFIPGQSEPLSILVRRLMVGQSVPMVGSGVYGDEQLFESEMMEKFDVLDRESDLRALVSRRDERAAEEPPLNEEPPQETPPPA